MFQLFRLMDITFGRLLRNQESEARQPPEVGGKVKES